MNPTAALGALTVAVTAASFANGINSFTGFHNRGEKRQDRMTQQVKRLLLQAGFK